MASLTVTYLFCRLLQSDVCHRTKDLINASPFESCNWLRLHWQTITKSFLPATGWQGVRKLMNQKFDLTVLTKGDICNKQPISQRPFVAHLIDRLSNPSLATLTRHGRSGVEFVQMLERVCESLEGGVVF